MIMATRKWPAQQKEILNMRGESNEQAKLKNG
jgi:hypothetical protein